ncbi:MAG TPA: lactate utilization protein [Candidatus Deferrimicrobiaceae bacterium]
MGRIEIGLWHLEVRGKKCVEALRRNGFDAEFFPTQELLRKRVLKECETAHSIGFGGSFSISEMGIYESLEGKGKLLLDHGRVPAEKKAETRIAQQACDLFLTGTNAVTLTGVLVNLDGNGNRTNAMTFGPKRAIVVAGGNKIVSDVPDGIRRIKTVAAPRNAKRLGVATPCATTGICEECSSPQRICRVYSIIERKPTNSAISVYVCGDPMGL